MNFYGYDVLFRDIGVYYERGNIQSLIGNTNYVSDFLASSLILILYGFYTSKNKKKSIILWCSGTLSAIVVLWCQTRSVYLGLFISLILFFLLWIIIKRKEGINFKKTVMIMISLIIAVYFFAFPPGLPEGKISPLESALGRTQMVISEETSQTAAFKRLLEWETSYKMFKENPVFGHGWGSFKLLSSDFQAEITNSNPKFYGYYQKDYESHSDFLQILAEGGTVSLISFIVIIIYILFSAFQKILQKDMLSAAVLCSWLVIFVHAFVEFPLRMQPSSSLFAIYSAFLIRDRPRFKPKKIFFIILLILLSPMLFLGLKFVIADAFTARSHRLDSKISDRLENYDTHISKVEELVGEQNQNVIDMTKKTISTDTVMMIMDQIFYSKTALELNPDNSYYIYYLTRALYYMNYFDDLDKTMVISSFFPYITYESPSLVASKFRNPPQSKLSVPKDSKNSILLNLNKLLCEISMREVNMPIDPNAFYRIGKIALFSIEILIAEMYSEEVLEPWKEWMKYSYRLALKMRGRDSSDWYCIDIEFLNALADIEGITKEFEDEFIFRLQHREKLIEYGIDDDLPALWYDFYDQNISRLSSEQRELAKGLMLKIQRMVNENQK
jgi:O-antigen ligase